MTTEPEGIGSGSEGTGVHEVGEGVRDVMRDAQGQMKEKTREVKERVQETSRELKSEAEERANRWTTSMGEQIDRVARALRTASDALDDEGEGRMSAVSLSVAEQVERMGGYLREENPSAMVRDLEDMARRNPGAFVGTTFVAGLLIGRFLRSSEPSVTSDRGPGGMDQKRTDGARATSRSGAPTGASLEDSWRSSDASVPEGWEGDL